MFYEELLKEAKEHIRGNIVDCEQVDCFDPNPNGLHIAQNWRHPSAIIFTMEDGSQIMYVNQKVWW